MRIPSLRRLRSSLHWLQEQVDAEERRLLIQAFVVGVVVWAMVTVLKLAVHWGFRSMAALLAQTPSVAFVWVPLVIGALGVSWVSKLRNTTISYRDANGQRHALDVVEGDGLERAIALYFASEPTRDSVAEQPGLEARWRLPTFSLAFAKMAASFLTLASGGAGGLEASVVLVGESTAAGLFKPRGFSRLLPSQMRARKRRWGVLQPVLDFWRATQPEDLQAAQLCGIAAAIATLLGTPFAAAFFAIEVIYRRKPIVDRLIYALVSALIAFFLTHLVTGSHSPFPSVSIQPPIYQARYYVALLASALSLGVLSTAFRAARVRSDRWFRTRFEPRWQRHVAGALITGSCAIAAAGVLELLKLSQPQAARIPYTPLSQTLGPDAAWLVLGTGENIIAWALDGKLTLTVALVALGGRFCATLSTVTSGASAGLLFPTLCFGSLVAVCWSHVFHLAPALLVIPAMTASLVSVANVPLAGILLVIEGFGAQWIVPAMFALVWASIFAHKNSIYVTQRATATQGQILPGVSMRKIRVPDAWAGASLEAIGIEEHFGLTLVGMIDRRETPDGNVDERIVLNPPLDQVLTRADVLIVLGEDERLGRLSGVVSRESMLAIPPVK